MLKDSYLISKNTMLPSDGIKSPDFMRNVTQTIKMSSKMVLTSGNEKWNLKFSQSKAN